MGENTYYTYIMASRSHTLYIGVTGDLLRRVFQHKWKEHQGFTAQYNCDRLVWFERHQEVHEAIEREKELKGWRRARKIALIESGNPAWLDLSREWYEYEPADLPTSAGQDEQLKQMQVSPLHPRGAKVCGRKDSVDCKVDILKCNRRFFAYHPQAEENAWGPVHSE